MKKGMIKLLAELLKDSHRSDRELAKVLGTSQPTVTRMRNELLKNGLIQQFTIIPDFKEMGFEIMAITCYKAKRKQELKEETVKVTMSIPNVIFAARAEGMGKNAVMISLHKSYSDYSNFINDLTIEHADAIEDFDSMLISLKGLIVKPLSLKYLAELIDE